MGRVRGSKGAKEKPSEVPKLSCVVCEKEFSRDPHNIPKAKVCTPIKFKHVIRYKPQPDGSSKKIPCGCCRCVYKKTMAKDRTLDGKIIPSDRVKEFLEETKRIYGDSVWLAFRVGLNAMLRVTEISSLQIGDLQLSSKPLPRVFVYSLKKRVRLRQSVDIDQGTAEDLKRYIGRRSDGTVFGIPSRTLQHKFKQIVKRMGLPELSIHSLRHTGVFNRGRDVTNLLDLGYLRTQARHESIETTQMYLGYEERQRIEMAKKVGWF